MQPGQIASTGYQAAWPLLQQAGSLLGFTSFFDNFVTIAVLLFAWLIVILAFFILAVQLFITIIEFKLTTLAGFVLVPFALWNKTSFLAERVLGNVVASGVKVMVLAIIVGIGTTLFHNFAGAAQSQTPNLAQAMSLVLASITLFGLGIFGPGIASGLVSGAPQLGAGAGIGTVGTVGAAALLTGGAAFGAARLAGAGGLGAIRAGTSLGAGASTAYRLGHATSGEDGLAGIGAGLAGVARAGGGAILDGARSLVRDTGDSLAESAQAGRVAAWRSTGGTGPAASSGSGGDSALGTGAPDWVRRLRAEQRLRRHFHTTAQAIREGDRPGHGTAPDLSQGDY
jgi:type IV secretion system protein TrbL